MKQETNDDTRILCQECNREYTKAEGDKGLCPDCEEDFGKSLEEFEDDNGCEECGAPVSEGNVLCLQCKLDKIGDDKFNNKEV